MDVIAGFVMTFFVTGEQGMVDEAQKALEEAEALKKVCFFVSDVTIFEYHSEFAFFLLFIVLTHLHTGRVFQRSLPLGFLSSSE